MSQKITIQPNDIADAEDIDFTVINEKWNSYTLKDGTTLNVKTVLTGVKRLKKYNNAGEPIYVINTNNNVRVKVPKKLRVKPKVTSGTPTV